MDSGYRHRLGEVLRQRATRQTAELRRSSIQDPDAESLIRKYLKAGVMDKGTYSPTGQGTPQGGNLSHC